MGYETKLFRYKMDDLLPLGAHFKVAEFHHKLCFKVSWLVITSQVIIEVSLPVAAVPQSVPRLGPAPGLESVLDPGPRPRARHQGLHHLEGPGLHHLLQPARGLDSGRVPLSINISNESRVSLHRNQYLPRRVYNS